MKTKASASISRVQTHKGSHVSIRVVDEVSHMQVCELELSLEEFARLICNESFGDITCHLGDYPERLGKVRESKKIEYLVGEVIYGDGRKEAAIKEGQKHCPEGWTLSEYFGSQDSFFYDDDKMWARTTIMRWV